jgi:hypothetical protein
MIVLHGLFVLDVLPLTRQIQISSPDCTKLAVPHKYLAGPWSKHTADYKTVKGSHDQSWDSTIVDQPDFGKLPVLEGHMGSPEHSNAYLSFTVPYPRAVRPLRGFMASDIDYPTCCIRVGVFPLAMALEYDTAPSTAPIEDTSIKRDMDYHVFAEPDCVMTCQEAAQHGLQAIRKLWALFKKGPDSGPIPKLGIDCCKSLDPANMSPCKNSDEELSLAELKIGRPLCNKIVKEKGVHLPMCASFIVP